MPVVTLRGLDILHRLHQLRPEGNNCNRDDDWH